MVIYNDGKNQKGRKLVFIKRNKTKQTFANSPQIGGINERSFRV